MSVSKYIEQLKYQKHFYRHTYWMNFLQANEKTLICFIDHIWVFFRLEINMIATIFLKTLQALTL